MGLGLGVDTTTTRPRRAPRRIDEDLDERPPLQDPRELRRRRNHETEDRPPIAKAIGHTNLRRARLNQRAAELQRRADESLAKVRTAEMTSFKAMATRHVEETMAS